MLRADLFWLTRNRMYAVCAATITVILVLLSYPYLVRSQTAEVICRFAALALVFFASAALVLFLAKCNLAQPLRFRIVYILTAITHLLSTISAMVYAGMNLEDRLCSQLLSSPISLLRSPS